METPYTPFRIWLTENEIQRLRYVLHQENSRIRSLGENDQHKDYLEDLHALSCKVEAELAEV